MKYHIITFGCQTNKSDSERIAAYLESIGYNAAPDITGAALIVVNMCSVRQSAVDRVYGRVKDFAKLKIKNEKLKIILTGCILSHDLKRFNDKKCFDYILAIKTLPYWKEALNKPRFIYYPNQRNEAFNKEFHADYFRVMPRYSNIFSAYIPVSTGCNNFCAYCVVPHTRGPEISRPAKDILNEAMQLTQKGAKEIWLIGQNVNSYCYEDLNFPTLLGMVNNVMGNTWLNFTSSHPKDFSDKLIKTIVKCDSIGRYISLPLQSGNNEVLKKMNRPYTIQEYRELVEKIRKEIPDVSLSTDVIVGFPGETQQQFEDTVKAFQELKPDMAYIAEYSPRPNTTAWRMKDDVPLKEKVARREQLTNVLKQTTLQNNKKYIGKNIEVLIHSVIKNKFLVGKAKNYKTLKIEPRKIGKQNLQHLVGEIINVKIIDAMPWGLKAIS